MNRISQWPTSRNVKLTRGLLWLVTQRSLVVVSVVGLGGTSMPSLQNVDTAAVRRLKRERDEDRAEARRQIEAPTAS